MNRKTKDIEKMKKSHEEQKKTLDLVVSYLGKQNIDLRVLYRAELQKFTHIHADLLISIGGDGTFLEVSHYVEGAPLLGINSDPENSVGFFCFSDRHNFIKVFNNLEVIKHTKLNRLELEINGKKIKERVLDDILIAHNNPAAVTRYELSTKDYSEKGKGSGLLICTAAGSTAFMYSEDGKLMDINSDEMQFLQRGKRDKQPRFTKELYVRSCTRQGKIFIDGPHKSYDFTLGDEVYIRPGESLDLVGDLNEKRKKFD